MIILFAPSEGKRIGGDAASLSAKSLLFPHLYEKRLEVISAYEKVVREGSYAVLSDLFGLKDETEFKRYKTSFASLPTMKAIERYDGVAYEYLSYATLAASQQTYLDRNIILFSNLLGPISAGDCIPDYKLKQGSSINGMAPEKFYKKHFSQALDERIGEEEILDLRAGFYDKFYTPNRIAITMKFLKEGKIVSHWAKAYRGIVLRTMAMKQVQSWGELQVTPIDGLTITQINETDKKREIVYAIS